MNKIKCPVCGVEHDYYPEGEVLDTEDCLGGCAVTVKSYCPTCGAELITEKHYELKWWTTKAKENNSVTTEQLEEFFNNK